MMTGVGDRRDQRPQSHLQLECLEDPSIRSRIRVLWDLVSSCRGPQGKAKVIQNSAGGHVTWTKISSRLFFIMSVSTPVLKLMMNSFHGHLDRYRDGGFLTAEFCLSLVDGSLKLDLHKKLVIDLYEEFADIIDNYLTCEKCECSFNVDVFNMSQVLTVLRSICKPKLSHLSCTVQQKMCILFLDVFLSTIPLRPQEFLSDRVHILCLENTDILDSTCLKGLLVECPELSSVEEKFINVTTSPNSDGIAKVKVALVVESMSGDAKSFVNAVYEADERVDCNSVVVGKLLEASRELIQAGVGLLLCQRVIHPKVKATLRQAGVIFVDRLGSQLIPYIRDLTGASPISVLSGCPRADWIGFGWLDGIYHQIWSDKSYLLFKHEDQPIITLVLKSYIEENLKELKTLSQSAVTSLQLLLKDPRVVSGGGCWMSHVRAHLSKQVQENMTSLVEDFDCTESQVLLAEETFSRCLMSLAVNTTSDGQHLTDIKYNHIWKTDDLDQMTREGHTGLGSNVRQSTCNCGMVLTERVDKFEYVSEGVVPRFRPNVGSCETDDDYRFPEVVDSLCVVKNALKMAVATANTVINVAQFIHDPL